MQTLNQCYQNIGNSTELLPIDTVTSQNARWNFFRFFSFWILFFFRKSISSSYLFSHARTIQKLKFSRCLSVSFLLFLFRLLFVLSFCCYYYNSYSFRFRFVFDSFSNPLLCYIESRCCFWLRQNASIRRKPFLLLYIVYTRSLLRFFGLY